MVNGISLEVAILFRASFSSLVFSLKKCLRFIFNNHIRNSSVRTKAKQTKLKISYKYDLLQTCRTIRFMQRIQERYYTISTYLSKMFQQVINILTAKFRLSFLKFSL